MTYKSKVITDFNKTLKDYNIDFTSSVWLVDPQTMRSGFMAPDVRKQSYVPLGQNPYKYYKVSPGLNYAGQCKNENCGIYKQRLCVQRGFGRFEYHVDTELDALNSCKGN